MSTHSPKPKWSLPYSSPLPPDGRRITIARVGRVAVYVAIAAMLLVPVIKFQISLARRIRKLNEHNRLLAEGKIAPGTPTPKGHKGAITRWCNQAGQPSVVHKLWAGGNIYKRHPGEGDVRLHPNMPFVVILLTPLAYIDDALTMTLCFNLLKVIVLVCSILMCARLAGDRNQRAPDWVVALGLGWAVVLVIGDIQHGNTNSFVLGAIVLHLWLYRRGSNVWSGAALALAICLKLTPALFLLYWLYQRNWKLLAATAAACMLFAVAVPAAILGPARYSTLMGTWLNEMIIPATAEGKWYPIHINQSMSGVISRYFLAGRNGNIFWNPDDWIYKWCPKHQWITVLSLSAPTAKAILRICQLAVLGLAAWAIGFKRLTRDDGRRMLHYGLVILAMMLMNQRTWDHHAAVLPVATIAIWQATAMGRMSRRARGWALGLVLAAGTCLWLTRNDAAKTIARLLGVSADQASHAADVVAAYGPTCLYFLLLFAASVILCRALNKSERPYAAERQKVLG